jgi:hypothetical protein
MYHYSGYGFNAWVENRFLYLGLQRLNGLTFAAGMLAFWCLNLKDYFCGRVFEVEVKFQR